MADNHPISVKDAVYKLQLQLLEGISHENQLFAAGSLMSRSDYEDVVTERSIANLCGYPLCRNSLPLERPRKGHYRISLKEHKVYDLHETYMFCSSSCVVNSRAFAGNLQTERCSVSSSTKIDEVLRFFGDLSLDDKETLGEKGNLGFPDLKIQEKEEIRAGEVSLEDWIGPSNAIEGYVPQRDRRLKPSHAENRKEVPRFKHTEQNKEKGKAVNEMDFKSTIIMGNQFNIAKTSSVSIGDQFNIVTTSYGSTLVDSETELIKPKGKANGKDMKDQFSILEKSSAPMRNDSKNKFKNLNEKVSKSAPCDQPSIWEFSSTPIQDDSYTAVKETALKSSLKSMGAKKLNHSVTWADEKKTTSVGKESLCNVQDLGETPDSLGSSESEADNCSSRLASAEACAIALNQAAEAIASGKSEVTDAVTEAGIVILPHRHDADEADFPKDKDLLEPEVVPLKEPTKPGSSYSDLFHSEDSWYDTPPEGFNLALSSFATMWMALFGWITSSSLAYIYGHGENSHEEYLVVNGREYPHKIVLSDGRSSEIKKTLAGCLARTLPCLVSDLQLPTPISTLEQGMGRLLDTMSFIEALPSFRTKQWQVVVLLFLDALSVCRIPALTPHMTSRRMILHKALDGAQVSIEEYEVMKDLLIPLGRLPEFSVQSGG